ncbi:glycyl-radical enzyme activating protein [Anaeromassilibacillus senegalensis]|uniref:glycyl-radical enzyme activating protein n=1 Tax=Anaeromassilibacillus senegalensis TaxID=1673717 RepID=UPI000680635D|nr:glycyl-radical enzyme activating protein [Anaeromassilibacillus senegalensis]
MEEKRNLLGCVFDIQRFSLDDGQGIRTVVFLKGCNQICPWCHNPESLSSRPEIFHAHSLCTHCGSCARVCPAGAISLVDGNYVTDGELCIRCGKCAAVCTADSCRMMGKNRTPEQVMEEILKDQAYYEASGGGVTFSGGEPTLQAEFLKEILRLCKEQGIHTAIETNGNNEWDVYEGLLPLLDFVMIDLKHTDDVIHQRVIGASNRRPLETLAKLCGRVPLEVRTPVIPGFNDQVPQLQDILHTAREMGVQTIRLLPYHAFGIGKYTALGKAYSYPARESMRREELETLLQSVDTEGITVKIG